MINNHSFFPEQTGTTLSLTCACDPHDCVSGGNSPSLHPPGQISLTGGEELFLGFNMTRPLTGWRLSHGVWKPEASGAKPRGSFFCQASGGQTLISVAQLGLGPNQATRCCCQVGHKVGHAPKCMKGKGGAGNTLVGNIRKSLSLAWKKKKTTTHNSTRPWSACKSKSNQLVPPDYDRLTVL